MPSTALVSPESTRARGVLGRLLPGLTTSALFVTAGTVTTAVSFSSQGLPPRFLGLYEVLAVVAPAFLLGTLFFPLKERHVCCPWQMGSRAFVFALAGGIVNRVFLNAVPDSAYEPVDHLQVLLDFIPGPVRYVLSDRVTRLSEGWNLWDMVSWESQWSSALYAGVLTLVFGVLLQPWARRAALRARLPI